MRLVVVNAGVSDPSSTGLLSQRLTQSVVDQARVQELEISVHTIELRSLANEIANGLVSGLTGPKLTVASTSLGTADAIIAATPVYKAGVSGLFKSFFDLLDNDLLIAKPVLLAATAGTARHALVVDDAMRSLLAYLRAMTVPTSVFAASEDWGTTELGDHIARASQELVVLTESGIESRIREESWGRYQHELGSNGGQELAIDLDNPMMRLAAGGSAVRAA